MVRDRKLPQHNWCLFFIQVFNMNQKKIGEAIAFLRKKAGYTQKDLAERIGISDKAVSKWERGLALPDLSYIAKVAVLLDTDTDSLLVGNTEAHKREWGGVLYLPPNDYSITVGTSIYGKPMVYFLLGYFLLMGIKDIWIICNEQERKAILEKVGMGDDLGIHLHFCYSISDLGDDSFTNYMVVFDRHFLYGVDQTKFFQRAMANKDNITILSLPKFNHDNSLYYNINRELVHSESKDKVLTEYNYGSIPILFCPKSSLNDLFISNNHVDNNGFSYKETSSILFNYQYLQTEQVFTETLDRGYVEMSMNTPDEILDVSEFVRIVQRACGMELYCIEEIAWRRGLIDTIKLIELGTRYGKTQYGEYILSLCK